MPAGSTGVYPQYFTLKGVVPDPVISLKPNTLRGSIDTGSAFPERHRTQVSEHESGPLPGSLLGKRISRFFPWWPPCPK
ncbi:MAG: hypothetical protein JWN56_342 [Sphingobacteriales bacterium]|nr:hypothetical protein [Sphingobacteriales bacterium]